MSSNSSHKGSPAGPPHPKSQHKTLLRAEQGGLCELFGTVPRKPHLTQAPVLVGTAENSCPQKKAEQKADPGFRDSSAVYLGGLTRLAMGRSGDQPWMSWKFRVTVAPAAPGNWEDTILLDQPKEENVFRPFPTSCAVSRPAAVVITGGQQGMAWEGHLCPLQPLTTFKALGSYATLQFHWRYMKQFSRQDAIILGSCLFLRSFSLVSQVLASKKGEKWFKTAKANRLVRVLISSSKTAHILGF